jgi:hypothetical protein
MGKKPRSGTGMNIPDHISESLESIFWVKILKFFDASDPGLFLTPGSGIRNPQHCKKGVMLKSLAEHRAIGVKSLVKNIRPNRRTETFRTERRKHLSTIPISERK